MSLSRCRVPKRREKVPADGIFNAGRTQGAEADPRGRKEAMTGTFTIRTTSREEFVDITDQVVAAVEKSGATDGAVLVFVPHTTAGVTINENADPDVVHD